MDLEIFGIFIPVKSSRGIAYVLSSDKSFTYSNVRSINIVANAFAFRHN